MDGLLEKAQVTTRKTCGVAISLSGLLYMLVKPKCSSLGVEKRRSQKRCAVPVFGRLRDLGGQGRFGTRTGTKRGEKKKRRKDRMRRKKIGEKGKKRKKIKRMRKEEDRMRKERVAKDEKREDFGLFSLRFASFAEVRPGGKSKDRENTATWPWSAVNKAVPWQCASGHQLGDVPPGPAGPGA